LNNPILWPLTIIMSDTNYDLIHETTLFSGPSANDPRNWADLTFNGSETNGYDCLTSVNDFSCFLQKGFSPSDNTPFRGFGEQQVGDHNPDLSGPVANHRNLPLGTDGVPGHNSTGIWIAGTTGNQVTTPTNNPDPYVNLDHIEHAVQLRWPVFIPISDRFIMVGTQRYYHVIDVACFVIHQNNCCGTNSDIVGIFRGFGWSAGNGTYSNNLHRAVVDGQTVIQLGP